MKKARGIGRKVREHRLSAGLTQWKTVKLLGLPNDAIFCQVETGVRKSSPRMRTILKAFLEIPVEAVRIRAANLGILKPGRDVSH